MRRGARRALFVGAALVVMAPSGLRAEVRPINLDGCSGGCGSNAMDDADSAQDGAEAKITMSPIGAGRSRDALLFDPDAVPTVLASGFPSALTPNGGNDAGAHNNPAFVDFDYVFTHPGEVGDPTMFLSVASLTGERTFGDILFDSNVYFAGRSGELSSRGSPDMDFVASRPGYHPNFWREDPEPIQKNIMIRQFQYPWERYVQEPPAK